MRQRHEAVRTHRIINFFASIFLVLFILFLIGLVEMRVNAVNKVGQAPNDHQKNPLEVGWQSVWHTNLALAATLKPAPKKKPTPPPAYAAKLDPELEKNLELQSGETATFKVAMENIGTKAWHRSGTGYITLYVRGTTKGPSPFFNQSWYKLRQPARLTEAEVKTKATGTFEFIIQAPKKVGTYKETFEAGTQTTNKIIKGSRFTLTLTVVAKTEAAVTPSAGQLSENLSGIPSTEPNIRVGLFKITPLEKSSISYDAPYDITRANGELIKSVLGGQITSLSYDPTAGNYIAQTDTDTFTETEPIRLIPKNATDPATIATTSQLHQWSSTVVDNRFRGVIEIYFSPEKNTIWIVNQLPVDSYIKGVSAAVDNAHPEFLKAIYIAARTYAIFHYLNPYKHGLDGFTVDAVNDQVYRGYNQEMRTPHISMAIDATKGLVVAYKNEVVITPYFGQSDGRTRSWAEVWGGNEHPWLVSVATPADTGKILRGHGVGLGATDARARAQGGEKFPDILKYFYQGTTLKKLY